MGSGGNGREQGGWQPPQRPQRAGIAGRFVTLEPLVADRHAVDLHAAFQGHDQLWDYMASGPFASAAAYHRWARENELRDDQVYFALRDTATDSCGGIASYLRIAPEAGSIEVGSITIAPRMQRSTAWTEAMYLMMKWAFETGYRRYEWKCDALNLASRRAAERLGFRFEGIFRNHMIVKGRNRDTAWFSVIDSEWPNLAGAFTTWLNPANFDSTGQQRERLSDLTRRIDASGDPGQRKQ